MKILHLSHRVPFPATDGGAIAISNMIEGLSKNGCKIDLIAINTPKAKDDGVSNPNIHVQKNVFVDTKLSVKKLLKNLVSTNIPYNVARFYNDAVNQQLITCLQQNTYDFILLESAFTTMYIDTIRAYTKAPIIVRPHNVESVIWKRLAVNEPNILLKWYKKNLAKRLHFFETKYYSKADGIAAITENDKQRMEQMGIRKPIVVIPAGVNLEKYNVLEEKSAQKNSIFIISSLDWAPNIEGLKWFLDNIWPVLIKKRSDIKLHIAGKKSPEWLNEIASDSIVVHGFVEDSMQFQQEYELMLVPLLSGSGMRVKIIEGFANKKCIISTTIGAEGIPYSAGENIVIADTVEQWVNAILYYLDHPEQRMLIGEKAKQLAFDHFDSKQLAQKVLSLFETIKEHQ